MDPRNEDLTGMTAQEAKEYVAAHVATLVLTRKKIAEGEALVATWERRAGLASQRGDGELAAAATAEQERGAIELERLRAEERDLVAAVERMRRNLPGVAARERSVDPDLLEQELAMAAGHMPGDEAEAATERAATALERDAAAEDALAALKAKMGLAGGAEEENRS